MLDSSLVEIGDAIENAYLENVVKGLTGILISFASNRKLNGFLSKLERFSGRTIPKTNSSYRGETYLYYIITVD